MDRNKFKRQIKLHEGYMRHRYIDTTGNITVGVGFNLNRQDARAILTRIGVDFDAVINGEHILTDQEIESLLEVNIDEAINDAEALVSNFKELDDVRQRVVADMAFNLGRRKFSKFKNTIGYIERYDFKQAASNMKDSLWFTQVKGRGRVLVNMMETGEDTYDF